MNKVMCERCQGVFHVGESIWKNELETGVTEHGFKCPLCGDVTGAYKTNAEVEKLQAEVMKERKRADKRLRNGMSYSKATRKLKQARKKLKKVMDELNGRVSDDQNT